MIITRERDVFTYWELSPEAQQKAAEMLRTEAWEHLDSDMITEDMNGTFVEWATGEHPGCISVNDLRNEHGVRIYWQVAYVQSDHTSIEGYLDRETSPNLDWPENVTAIKMTVSNLNNTIIGTVYVGEDQEYCHDPKVWDQAEEMIGKLNRKLYRLAQSLCESYTDEEYVLDMYANCYGFQRRFTEAGEYAPMEFWQDEVAA